VNRELEQPSGLITPEFRNRLFPFDEKIKNAIAKLKSENTEESEQENLFHLFSFLMNKEAEVIRQKESLSVQKKSTRDEVMKRLLTSVDYVYSLSDQKLSLDELAQAACLSKFHFLRLFKSTFHKTPYQFINEVRVERAKDLLKNSELSVREIAHQTGFDSSSSFSRTFHHTQGIYPTQFASGK
jgi:AraC family transcriptional regulator